ncbi:hypothetical protein KC345_g5630 [Hortaea werneckii]|nr:hypothetical protein KC345_g5630 [Hortaea werneckii]
MPSCNPSTNGPLPNHPQPSAAPTTLQKFLGIPTTTSVHFACTLFALVEILAFAVLRSGAVAFFGPPQPLAVLLFLSLFSLLFWHQRRCVRDLLTRSHPDCEAGGSSATNAVTASAKMGPEGEELLGDFDKFQIPAYAVLAGTMVIFGVWVGFPAAAIVAGAVVSLLEFLVFLELCREFRYLGRVYRARRVESVGARQREEGQHHHHLHQQQEEVEGSTVRPSEPREDVASSGEEIWELDSRRPLSCIPEEEEEGPSAQDGDNHHPANLVLSQQAQDMVWNRVRFLAARETLSQRRRKKLFVRRAMREMQGKSMQGSSGDDGVYAMPADSVQRSRKEVSEEMDRQGQGDGGSRRVWERRGAISGETKDGRGTSGAFSSGQPSSTTMPTMGSDPSTSVPQQQTFPTMENPSHVPAAMERTDPQQKQERQERHIEAMNHLAYAKDSEIATLRARMQEMTKYFRTREEASRAAHVAEFANAWRNAQVLFEKVGKLEEKLAAGSSTRKEGAEQDDGEWIGSRSTEQEETMGRELGILAQEETREELEDDSVRRRQQEQQEDEAVEEEERESTKQDQLRNPLLCQNTGCFCHFPVVAPQKPQQQQQRQEEVSTDADEATINPQDRIAEIDDDETNNNDDDAFTIILESNAPSSSSSSSSSSSRGDESPGTLTPAEGSEISLCEWETQSTIDSGSDSDTDELDDEIHV